MPNAKGIVETVPKACELEGLEGLEGLEVQALNQAPRLKLVKSAKLVKQSRSLLDFLD